MSWSEEVCKNRMTFHSLSSKSRIIFIILYFIGVILISLSIPTTVSALGVAPSSFHVSFEEGIHGFNLRILNSDHQDLFLSLSASGDLKDFVSFENETVHILPNELSKSVNYKVNFPEGLSPGTHILKIIVKQEGVGFGVDKSSVSLGLKISQLLYVDVPYDGEYLEQKIFTTSEDSSGSTIFTVYVMNKGDSDVVASGKLRVLSPANEVVETLHIPEQNFPPITKTKLMLKDDGVLLPGVYTVESSLYYHDFISLEKKSFVVGKPFVKVLGVSVDPFSVGNIAKVHFNVISSWNKKIDDVYAKVEIYDGDILVSMFKTPLFSLSSNTNEDVIAYWDTKKLSEKNYSAHVTVYFEGRKETQNYLIKLSDGGSEFVELDKLTGSIIRPSLDSPKSRTLLGGSHITDLLLLILLVIIILNVVWFTNGSFYHNRGYNSISEMACRLPPQRKKWSSGRRVSLKEFDLKDNPCSSSIYAGRRNPWRKNAFELKEITEWTRDQDDVGFGGSKNGGFNENS